jgi:hypothetical protein
MPPTLFHFRLSLCEEDEVDVPQNQQRSKGDTSYNSRFKEGLVCYASKDSFQSLLHHHLQFQPNGALKGIIVVKCYTKYTVEQELSKGPLYLSLFPFEESDITSVQTTGLLVKLYPLKSKEEVGAGVGMNDKFSSNGLHSDASFQAEFSSIKSESPSTDVMFVSKHLLSRFQQYYQGMNPSKVPDLSIHPLLVFAYPVDITTLHLDHIVVRCSDLKLGKYYHSYCN